ncbi:MAG: elongation factor P [Cytophagales bacterium]
MATTADIRNGLCILHKGGLYKVVSFLHVKPGKGGAFVRTKLKGIVSERVIDHTFNAGVKIDVVRVEERSCQFLYKDATHFHFMDESTFETFPVETGKIGQPALLKEGEKINILFRGDTNQPLACKLPLHIWLKVAYTDRGIKGSTVNKPTKSAQLETGIDIQVPLFVQIGDEIKIDTATLTYLARRKPS